MPASGYGSAGTGPQGPKGDTGAAGPANTLSVGTVAQGSAAATITGTSPNQTLNLTLPKGDTGAQGPQGNPGATGPSAKVSLGNITVTETAVVAISAGIRTLTYTGISGLLAGDDVVLFPINALPTGYAIHNSVATANGTLQVTLNAPLLAIGASYSIVCKVVALR